MDLMTSVIVVLTAASGVVFIAGLATIWMRNEYKVKKR